MLRQTLKCAFGKLSAAAEQAVWDSLAMQCTRAYQPFIGRSPFHSSQVTSFAASAQRASPAASPTHKRPSGYNAFQQQRFSALKAAHPQSDNAELQKMLGQQWKALPMEERESFKIQSAKQQSARKQPKVQQHAKQQPTLTKRMTAFQLYIKEHFAAHKGTGVSASELMKNAAQAWKAEPEEQKAKLQAQLEAQYGPKLAPAAKPPRHGYHNYVHDYTAKLRQDNPGLRGIELFKVMAKHWKTLSPEQKQKAMMNKHVA